ncbi:Putative glutamine amidotransferase-like protein C13C5.04 [Cladobotryum mycophilum]|uniref:Glutamine amidotransferase-like protein C13C5.04 n=1 Tax=Cladobotryum mycophilum TaxID=491253 RepID=A0ABR0T304_9HYPO
MSVFRLAILETDVPFPIAQETRGSYGDIFRDLLTTGLRNLGPKGDGVQLEVTKWDVLESQTYPAVDAADGFLITGSRYNAYDNDPWILKLVGFIGTVLATTEKPIVGTCFGHQIMGRVLGSKVAVNPNGWEISVQNVNFNEAGQKLFGVPSLELHQFHHDIVFEVPPGVINLGSSSACANQVFYRPGRILTFQGHPEFDNLITSEILKSDLALTLFDEAAIKGALSRVGRPHGGLFLGAKMAEFLLASQLADTKIPLARL